MKHHLLARASKFTTFACLFLYACQASASTASSSTKSVEDIVLESSTQALQQLLASSPILNTGRKSLIQLMQHEPHQLEIDLPRVPKISIGGRVILKIPSEDGSAKNLYDTVADQLEQYVKQQRPELKSIKGKIGEFFTAELVYAVVQSFTAPSQVEAHLNDPSLMTGLWAAYIGESDIESEFYLCDTKAPILTVSSTTKKTLINTAGGKTTKKFVTEAKLLFDLEYGDVMYRHRYAIDGNEKSWCTNS